MLLCAYVVCVGMFLFISVYGLNFKVGVYSVCMCLFALCVGVWYTC